MSIVKTEAIVLRKRDYRESSLLVDFFTNDFGKIRTIIKGAKRNKANIDGDLAIFSCNHIVFYESKHTDINKLTQCQLINRFETIRKDISKIAVASYFIELVDALSSVQDPNQELFETLKWSLELLGDNEYPSIIATVFQIKLLHLSGILPDLEVCCVCKKHIPIESIFFSVLLGGILCKRCADSEPSGVNITRDALRSMQGISKLALDKTRDFDFPTSIRLELDDILRDIFRFHVERNLKSLEFLTQILHACPPLADEQAKSASLEIQRISGT
jgi:DNA repair protein RecO (recombination protein O)